MAILTIAVISICTFSAFSLALMGAKAFVIPVVLITVFLTLRYHNFLIYIFLASTPLISHSFRDVATIYNYFLVMIIIFIWISRNMLTDNKYVKISKDLLYFVIAFLFFASVSALNGGVTADELSTLIRFSIFFIFIFAVYDLYAPKDTIKFFVFITLPLILSSVFLFITYSSASGIYEFLNLYRLKPAGLFDNSNGFALTLISVIPFWLAMAWWCRNKFAKVLSWILLFVLIPSLVLTNARAAFVGFFITLLIYFAWARKLRYFLGAVSLLVVIFLSFPAVRTIVSAGLRIDRGASSREEVWGNTAKMISENYMFGVGIGNFQEEYDPYFETAWLRGFFVRLSHAHNQILSKTAELGIMGVFIMIALYYLPIRAGVRALKKTSCWDDRAAVYGMIGGLVALYGRSIFEASGILAEGRLYPDVLFWLLFVMLLKMANTEKISGEPILFSKKHIEAR